MYKIMGLLKKRAGLSTAEFRDYYETYHRVIGEKYLGQFASRYLRRYLSAFPDPITGRFRLDGDTASGECYVLATTTVIEEGKKIDRIVGGRYLDRYEKRAGCWKFLSRIFVLDWNINQPCSAEWEQGMFALMTQRGSRDKQDASYRYIS